MSAEQAHSEKSTAANNDSDERIAVLLIDDHAMVRQGLRLFIDMQDDMVVAGEGSNGWEAIDLANHLHPDVILLDLQMPGLDGIEATRAILDRHPDARILILTSFSDDNQVFPAIRAGATGYLLKDMEPRELLQAIRETYRGRSPLHPKITQRLMAVVAAESDTRHAAIHPAADDDLEKSLTDREKEVLELIAQGLSNREIAIRMVISEKTVKTHVSSLLDKLDCEDRTRAAIWGLKHGYGC